MKNTLLSTIIAAAGIIVLQTPALAHGDGHPEKPETTKRYGASAALGAGSVRTYITMSKEKDERSDRRAPLQLGVEIPSAVMSSLPTDMSMLILDFPIQARNTTMQYMMLDWNPQGHEPAGIYDKPHFDFHFYIQDLEDVMAIDPGPCSGLACDDYALATKPVPFEFLPQGYIDVGSVVPYMGNHLIDPGSPEFNGQLFTRTFLYGAYDGHITFYEPMITKASMLDQPNQCTALKLPAAYEESGFYPKSYCTEFDTTDQVYRVYLKDFEYRYAPRGHGRR